MWRVLLPVLLLGCGNKNNTPTTTEDAADPADGATRGGDANADGGGADAGGADAGGVDGGAADGGAVDGAADGGAEPPVTPTPESLYAECKERVEGVQAEGECKADADCKAAGCGSEVCTTATEAAQVMTTCEGRLCFKVLDTCGCHEGQCTWTLKAEVPELKDPGNKLPPTRLPPSPPPTEGGE